MGSVQEAIDYAASKLPITTRNELVGILMVYQNTFLNVAANQPRK
jgi:hypothetical protein